MHSPSALVLSALVSLAVGAASPLAAQKVPDWDEEGLVVGQVAGVSAFGLSTAAEVPVALTVGRRAPTGGSVHRGYVAFRHEEGDVKLTDLFGTNGRAVVHLPIGRQFAVQKGTITVVGLMYFLQKPEDRKAFRVVAFDNRDETIDYLRRVHPALIAGHDSAAVVLAPGDYLAMEKLVKLYDEQGVLTFASQRERWRVVNGVVERVAAAN